MRPVLVFAAGLAVGCVPFDVPPTACDSMAVASVRLTVLDEFGASVTGATARWSSDQGASGSCDGFDGREFSCGFEVSGTLVIFVDAPGYLSGRGAVMVPSAGCHVEPQALTVRLRRQEQRTPQFPEARRYVHDWFETPADCEAAQARGENCTAELTVCPDGAATLMLTDISNGGRYAVEGDAVVTQWNSLELPAVVRFLIQPDGGLQDDLARLDWTRTPDEPALGVCP
jgi:hypothetical protein